MPNDIISTSTLLQRLFKTASISRFLKRHESQMVLVPFASHLADLCKNKNLVPAHVILKSGIERTYGHQLFNGKRKPSRDKVLQLAFGFGLSYDEAQDLLKKARKSQLYPRIKRDAAVIYALVHNIDITDTQIMLYDLGLPLLGKEDRYD